MAMDPTIIKNDVDQIEHCRIKTPMQVVELPDPAAERRLVRKLDRTILPWIMLLYLLSYIDRYEEFQSFTTDR